LDAFKDLLDFIGFLFFDVVTNVQPGSSFSLPSSISNIDGFTALDIAKESGHGEIVGLLEQHKSLQPPTNQDTATTNRQPPSSRPVPTNQYTVPQSDNRDFYPGAGEKRMIGINASE
jgi:ankyrin repeat protein